MSAPPSAPESSRSVEEARWFTEQVYPHDGQLRAYLCSAFPSTREEINDLVQESYLRVWKAKATQPIRSAKAFLFTIARRLALDSIRHERGSPILVLDNLAELPVVEEWPDVVEKLTREEKSQLLGQALASLPDRCRDIVYLHKIRGLSQHEVATTLRLSGKTVANQIGIGVSRCERFFRKHGIEYF